MSSARVRFNGIKVLVQGNITLAWGIEFVRRSVCAIPVTLPTVGDCIKAWPSPATYPSCSPTPLPECSLSADGQLCFLFISASDEDILAKGKQSIKSQALGNQNSENEALLEADDDTLSSVDEKDLENLAGNSVAVQIFQLALGQ